MTSALKTGGGAGGTHRSRLRSALVIAQAALSVVLLVGAALFVRSLSNVRGIDLGFDARRLMTATVHYDDSRRGNDPMFGQRIEELSNRIAALRGVEQTALTSTRPMYSFSTISYFTDTDSLGSRPHWMPTVAGVSRGFFGAAGLRMVRGSDFEKLGSGSRADVIVNEAMAARMWPGRDPIGQCLRLESRTAPCYTIRGIVQDSRMGKIIEEPAPIFYISLDHVPDSAKKFVAAYYVAIRVSPDRVATATADIRSLIRQEFPDGIPEIVRLSDYIEPQFRPWQLGATLFATFGLLALVVAAIGIYSTVAYGVSQRMHEFGVRIALGAHVGDVMRLVVGDGVRVVAIGVVGGLALALAAGRLIASLLYGITPRDPVTMAVVAATLLGVAVIAALVPARRAAGVDPVAALRAD